MSAILQASAGLVKGGVFLNAAGNPKASRQIQFPQSPLRSLVSPEYLFATVPELSISVRVPDIRAGVKFI